MNYLNTTRITATRITERAPRGDANQQGYGNKLPTHHMVRLDGRARWHRIYVICWSNSGTMYIVERGQPLYIASHWRP